jgi:hypothetical protein
MRCHDLQHYLLACLHYVDRKLTQEAMDFMSGYVVTEDDLTCVGDLCAPHASMRFLSGTLL